jgi:hypothetical protein
LGQVIIGIVTLIPYLWWHIKYGRQQNGTNNAPRA